MKIQCPTCFRNLDTLDADYIPAHSHTPLSGERCPGGDKSPAQAKAEATKAIKTARAAIAKAT